jgi:hypothetical protein
MCPDAAAFWNTGQFGLSERFARRSGLAPGMVENRLSILDRNTPS